VRSRKATLDDVARLSGVSKSTASRILRAGPGEPSPFDPRTRERVLRAVETLGFVPNRIAQGLTRARTGIIGLTIPSIEDSFFPAVTAAIEGRLAEERLDLILADSGGRSRTERLKVEGMLAWNVDGLIAAPCQETADPALFWDLWRRKTPFVLIDRTFPGTPFASVTTDDVAGAAEAVEHLVSRGRRRIARVGGSLGVETNRLRDQGYREGLVRGGLLPDPRLAVEAPPTIEGGRLAAARILEMEERPDAVFCFSDPVAAGFMDECLRRGARIPEDIAIVGYADLETSGMLRIPLTTVRQPKGLLGKTAAEMLLAILEKGPSEAAGVVLPVELVVRESTGGSKSKADV
jgi:LacI family transcriptional regulator